MNEYSISNYGIFSDAIATTNDCGNKVTTAKDAVTTCKTTISNQAVFMGPMADKCVSALTGLDTDCASIISNMSSLSSYLISTSSAYQAGDKNAGDTITNIGGLSTDYVGSNEQFTPTPGAMRTFTYNGKTFNITNSKLDLNSYQDYLQKNGLYQNAVYYLVDVTCYRVIMQWIY